ncbi:MAG: twin-arginine translocation signal domain-containing protein, partial [Selenomonas artemidis]
MDSEKNGTLSRRNFLKGSALA